MNSENRDSYNREAGNLVKQYESITFEELNQQTISLLPSSPCHVLDVGAGSGRDAAWFADQGYQVTAIEPAVELLKRAKMLHPSLKISWFEDSLPQLLLVKTLSSSFDLIWLSAVWMHLPQSDRPAAFANLDALLNHAGRMMFTLRHGPAPQGRVFHPVSVEEILSLAANHNMKSVLVTETADSFQRPEISWDTVMLEKE